MSQCASQQKSQLDGFSKSLHRSSFGVGSIDVFPRTVDQPRDRQAQLVSQRLVCENESPAISDRFDFAVARYKKPIIVQNN